jgi:cell wall-associated NlpC family hydrolase
MAIKSKPHINRRNEIYDDLVETADDIKQDKLKNRKSHRKFKIFHVKRLLLISSLPMGVVFITLIVIALISVIIITIYKYYPDDYNTYNKNHGFVSTDADTVASSDTISDYNKYTTELSQMDLSEILKDYPLNKVYKAADKGLSDRYWNSTYSPYADIELYLLLAEICTRDELNPSTSNYSIIPAYFLGTWWCEASTVGGTYPQEMYKSFDTGDNAGTTNIGSYKGFLQQNPDWYTGDSDTKAFTYISSFENSSLKDSQRAIWGNQSDILNGNGKIGVLPKAGGDDLGTSVTYDSVKSEITFSNGSTTLNRPNYDFFADACYTYAFMLRTNYSGADMYTLSSGKNYSYDYPQSQKLSSWISKLGLDSTEASYLAFVIYDRYYASRESSILLPDINSSSLTSTSKNQESKLLLGIASTTSGLEFGNSSSDTFETLADKIDDEILGVDMNSSDSSGILSSATSILSKASSLGYDGAFGSLSTLAYKYTNSRSGEYKTNEVYALRVLNIGLRMEESLEAEIEALYNASDGKYLKTTTTTSSDSTTLTQAIKIATNLFGYDKYPYTGNVMQGVRGNWGKYTNPTGLLYNEVINESYSLGTDPSGNGKYIASSSRTTDCSGLVAYLYQHGWNINLQTTAVEQWHSTKSLNNVKATTIESTGLVGIQSGDLIYFIVSGSYIDHVGIYIGGSYMLEANAGSSDGYKVVITTWNDSYWKPKIVGYKHYAHS